MLSPKNQGGTKYKRHCCHLALGWRLSKLWIAKLNCMEKTIQAIYKDGALQPLEALSLEEMQQVTVTITDLPVVDDLAGFFTPEEWAEAACDSITWSDAQQALSQISGSLSDAVIAQRQER